MQGAQRTTTTTTATNQVDDGSATTASGDRIHVFLRVRPFNPAEKAAREGQVIIATQCVYTYLFPSSNHLARPSFFEFFFPLLFQILSLFWLQFRLSLYLHIVHTPKKHPTSFISHFFLNFFFLTIFFVLRSWMYFQTPVKFHCVAEMRSIPRHTRLMACSLQTPHRPKCIRAVSLGGRVGATFSVSYHAFGIVLEPTVEEVLAGFNCTVFAYGQTGTGKTHTMEGGLEGGAAWSADHAQSGMIPRAVNQIFRSLEHNIDIEYSVKVSHMELYNEELIDLLATIDDKVPAKPLKMLEHPRDGVAVHNLEEVPVTSADAIFKILRKSNKRRTTAATKLNAASSRSHCIFTITVHTKETTLEGEEVIRVGKLNLVDLAGSENVARSGAQAKQDRKREAGVINQSLLTLGRVITSLTQGRPHIPYRESKLTRLLAESLGGRAKTSIIATIGPAASNMEETMSTLDYAHTAKNITNKPQMNNKMTKKALIKDYASEIERLKARLVAAREKNGVYVPPDEHEKMEAEMTAARERVAELEAEIEMKKGQLDELTTMFTNTRLELKQTAGFLKDASAELEDTKSKLTTTEANLRATAEHLDNTRSVVAAKTAAEEALYRDAAQILDVLEVREKDADLLHAKIQRKVAVEGTNMQITTDFRSYLSERMEGLTGKISDHTENHSDDLAGLRSQLTDFMQQKTSDIDVMCERFDALQAMITQHKEELVALASTQCDSHATTIKDMGKREALERSRASVALEAYARSATKAVEEWRQQLSAQMNQINAWGTKAVAALEATRASAEGWASQHKSDLTELKNASAKDSSRNAEWGQSHVSELTSVREALTLKGEEGKKALLADIGGLLAQFVTETDSELAKSMSQLTGSVEVHKKHLTETGAAIAQVLNAEIAPSVESHRKEVAESWTEVSESVSGKVADEVSRIQTDQTKSTAWQTRQEQLDVEARNELSRMNSAVAEQVECATASTDAFGKEHSDVVSRVLGQAAQWNEEAQGLVYFVNDSIGTMHYNVDQEVVEMKKSLEAWGSRMNADVAGIGDRFDNFFYALKDDVSTGQTPQKRAVPYPSDLPVSRSRAQVVEEYWEQLLSAPAADEEEEDAVAHFPDNNNNNNSNHNKTLIGAAVESPGTPVQKPFSITAPLLESPAIVPGSSPYSTPLSANSSNAAQKQEPVAQSPVAVMRIQSPEPAAPAPEQKQQPPVEEEEDQEPKVDKENATVVEPKKRSNGKSLPRDLALIRKMTVKDLRAHLKEEGLSDKGQKASLVERLVEHMGLAE